MKWDEILKQGYEKFLKYHEDLEYVVRCKDCIHRPYVVPAKYDISGKCVKYSYVTAPDDVCPYLCDDSWYNRVPEDTFFCAKGERNYERNENE